MTLREVREVVCKPLISLCGRYLREVREVSSNPLKSLAGGCGGCVPLYPLCAARPS